MLRDEKLCALQRYSAVSLRSITTEVLKVVNTTEDLMREEVGDPRPSISSLPPNTDPKKLDQQFSRLEENVSCILFTENVRYNSSNSC